MPEESDVDHYFNTPPVRLQEHFGKLDLNFVTDWWYNNRTEYPVMSLVARDYLAIPGSEVDLERLFSSGSDMIGIRRYSLKADTMRALILLKSSISRSE